jgi:hypothetical protein
LIRHRFLIPTVAYAGLFYPVVITFLLVCHSPSRLLLCEVL